MKPDPRYRTDQPYPVGTKVEIRPGDKPIEHYVCGYFTSPIIATVMPIDDRTLSGHVPILFPAGSGPMAEAPDGKRTAQWREEHVFPVADLPDMSDLDAVSRWLDGS